MPKPSVTEEALTLINGDRAAAYGDPTPGYAAFGLAVTAILSQKMLPGAVVDARESLLIMAALKLVREARNPKRDNTVDAIGYLALEGRVAGHEADA